jgi:hypothetical protein
MKRFKVQRTEMANLIEGILRCAAPFDLTSAQVSTNIIAALPLLRLCGLMGNAEGSISARLNIQNKVRD